MPLFPAYASTGTLEIGSDGEAEASIGSSTSTESETREARLLDSEDDAESTPSTAKRPSPVADKDFYLDTKFDGANLPVTTLYYPGRPQYDLRSNWKTLGLNKNKKRALSRGKQKRYYSSVLPSDTAVEAVEVEERAQEIRRGLAKDPSDQYLWRHYVHFQERCAGGEAALRAAAEAEAALGAGAPAAALRAELLALRARHLPRGDYCAMLHQHIAKEECPSAKLELWTRLVRAVGAEGGDASRPAVLAARAMHQLRHLPLAYPHLLYAYGCWVRDAGLWELLTMLVELVVDVCLRSGAPSTPLPTPRQESLDARLEAQEDEMIGSGLPMHAVWARVERARAHAHWHRAGGGHALDPQRAPHPADVADLLLPVADEDAALLLCAQLLRLAKVPLLPASGAVARAFAPSPSASACADDDPSGGEALLPLVAAARRLPAAHPARVGGAALASRVLARFLDPPHYFSDDNGYLRWVGALWDACCERAQGERRTALLCWRMRWWHALLLLLAQQRDAGAEREARRISAEARAALERFEGASPLPFALFARVQAAAAGATGAAGEAGARRARTVATRALRSALADARCPPHHRLYVARIVGELDRPGGPPGAWAVACAALGRPLPPDCDVEAPPPEELSLAALEECRRRCAEAERGFGAEGAAEARPPPHEALLPGAGEWLAALVALSPPSAPSPLPAGARLAALVADATSEAHRYWEQGACAWTTRAARTQRQARVAHALAPLFPRNAFLALAGGGAPIWAWGRPEVAGEWDSPRGSPEVALALLLPRLLRAERAQWPPEEADRVAAACAAPSSGGGGALAWCARLEAEARGRRARVRAALLGALVAQPHHKWVAVRGAALCPAEAAAVPDLLLERGLRVHALPDELRPLRHTPQ